MNDLFLFVDFQKVFELNEEWKIPDIKGCLARAKIACKEVEKVRNITKIVTRYMPPNLLHLRDKDDAWVKYFKKYSTVPKRSGDILYELIDYIPCDWVWESSEFSKWKHTSQCNYPFNVFITGVSTECCILSTALSAVDAGATVYVISDACAAGNKEDHNLGLELLSRFDPNVQIIKTEDITRMFNE